MKSFQVGREKKFFTRRRIILLALFIAAIILGKSAWNIYQKNKLADQNNLATQKELTDLEARASSLNQKINKLKTNRGLDEEIRQNFSVAKEGERVVTIVDKANDDTASDSVESATTTVPKTGLWQLIKAKIVGKRQ